MRQLSFSMIVVVSVILAGGLQQHCQAVIFSDDFNRPDGAVGNGWTTWGGGGDLSGGVLRTYPRTDGGGIARTMALTPGQAFTFEFDFAAENSVIGGWGVQVNTTNPEHWNVDNQNRLLFFYQHEGAGGVRRKVGANLWNGWVYSADARPFTGWAHIMGIVGDDLSAVITIDYRDGGPQAVFAFPSPNIDPATIPQGSLLSLGNSCDRGGVDFFDNFVLTPEPSTALLLMTAATSILRRRSPFA